MKIWKTGTVRENLLRTGMGCFAFAAGMTLVNIMLLPFARMYHGYRAVETLAACVLALSMYALWGRWLMRTDEMRLEEISRRWVPVCVTVLFVIQVTLGYMMEYTPSGDNFMLYNGSKMLASDGNFARNPDFGLYLARFSNQWGIVLIFTGLWKLSTLLGLERAYMLVMVVQALLYIPGVLSTLGAARRVRGVRAQLMLLAILMTCMPLYLASSVLYTDTFSLPFVMMALNLALRVIQEKDAKRQLMLCAACGLIMAIGGMIKMTVAIMLIAAAIVWALTLKPVRAAACVGLCSVMLLASNALVSRTMLGGPIDIEVYEQQNTPTIHWFMMSIPTADNPYGEFSGDYALTWRMMDEGESREVIMDSIYTRIKDRIYTLRYPDRLLMAALRKNGAAFGDGTFGLTEMLDDDPVRRNVISSVVLSFGEHYATYRAIASGIFFAHLLMAVAACVRDIRRRDLSMGIGYVAAFGMMLFLMLWEARTRYFFGYVPVILLLGSMAIDIKREGRHHEGKA